MAAQPTTQTFTRPEWMKLWGEIAGVRNVRYASTGLADDGKSVMKICVEYDDPNHTRQGLDAYACALYPREVAEVLAQASGRKVEAACFTMDGGLVVTYKPNRREF